MITLGWSLFVLVVSFCIALYAIIKYTNCIYEYGNALEEIQIASYASMYMFVWSGITFMTCALQEILSRECPNYVFGNSALFILTCIMVGITCFYLIKVFTNIFKYHYKKGCTK